MEPLFDLDVCAGKIVRFIDDGRDTVPFDGPFPVRVWVLAMDALDGYGWGRFRLECLGNIVEHYPHDVGAGDETEAVLMEVSRLTDLRALVDEFQLCDEVPSPLY